jgi:hypothetical protein
MPVIQLFRSVACLAITHFSFVYGDFKVQTQIYIKEKPVWKLNLALKNSPCPNNLKGVAAECHLLLGNEFCQAKPEYRTKKTLSRPST